MKSDDYKVMDDSGDRKYFTIVPNYVLNHSSAVEQALYLQMKRVAGENGLCFITQKHLCQKLGIGKSKLRTAMQYLIDHKWIEFVGTTESKTKPINTYKINDIWKLNVDHYVEKKISSKSAQSLNAKDKTQKMIDKTQPGLLIRPKTIPIIRTSIKEEPIIRISKKYSSLEDIKKSDIIEIADKYGVQVSFVRLQFERMRNWLESSGKRKKNYKATLRNFVLSNLTKLPSIEPKKTIPADPIDFVPISPLMLKEFKQRAFEKIGSMQVFSQGAK